MAALGSPPLLDGRRRVLHLPPWVSLLGSGAPAVEGEPDVRWLLPALLPRHPLAALPAGGYGRDEEPQRIPEELILHPGQQDAGLDPAGPRAQRHHQGQGEAHPEVDEADHHHEQQAQEEGSPSLEVAEAREAQVGRGESHVADRKSTRLNSSHVRISYAVFCLKKKKKKKT